MSLSVMMNCDGGLFAAAGNPCVVLSSLFKFITSEVHLIGAQVVKALMRTRCVVEVEVPLERSLRLPHRLVRVEVDVRVLHASPQSFAEYVINPASLSVHADPRHSGQQRGGELAPLIGVEYLWGALAPQDLSNRFDEELRRHGVADSPREHLAAGEVYDRHQVRETLGHGQVGDVGRQELVGALDLHIAQQVRIDLVLLSWDRGSLISVDRFDAPQPYEGSYVKPTDALAGALKHQCEPSRFEEQLPSSAFAHANSRARYWRSSPSATRQDVAHRCGACFKRDAGLELLRVVPAGTLRPRYCS
jgi:hypothetical protein